MEGESHYLSLKPFSLSAAKFTQSFTQRCKQFKLHLMDNKREMICWCREPFGGFNIRSPCCFPVFICLRPFLHESLSAQPSLITEPFDLSFQNPNCTLAPTQIMISLVLNMESCRLALPLQRPFHLCLPLYRHSGPFLSLSLENYLGSFRCSFHLYKTILIWSTIPLQQNPWSRCTLESRKFAILERFYVTNSIHVV